jgi:hypothetical protein
MERWVESFEGIRKLLPAEAVRMSGAWASKPQRRYASPEQLGSGAGPYVETVDWRWDGVFESASSLAGVAFLSVDQRVYWVKSQPPAVRPAVGFSAHGWAARPGAVSVAASFHGSVLPSAPAEIGEEPPAACAIGASATAAGTLHVVARIERVAFAVLLLPASAVRVGRNRLWHLREDVASQLPSDQRLLLTRGRSGALTIADRSPQ